MIQARFGLNKMPFDKSIATRDLYPWRGLEELTARLEMAKSSRGIMLLTGDPGMGKTVAVRKFVDSLNNEHYVCCYLPLATVTILDAYGQLNRALGGAGARSKSQMFDEIQRGVSEMTDRGKQPMDEEQTRGYVEHHLKLAGRKQRLFTDEAMIQLFVQSGGIARMVGNLALTAMTEAALEGKDVVGLEEVITASKEVM